MYNLAICFAKGRGVSNVDRQEALRWARMAIACAESNDSGALFSIGMAHTLIANWHFKEIELPRNDKLSLWHWNEGVRLGSPTACNMLGLCHMNALCGVQRNTANAVDFFRLACDNAIPCTEAMRNMGHVWNHLASTKASLRWLESAYIFGDTGAQEQIALLRQQGDVDAEASVASHAIPVDVVAGLSALRDATLGRKAQLGPFERAPMSLAELEQWPNKTPYLELLINAKQTLIRGNQLFKSGLFDPVALMRMYARMLLIPDSGTVFEPAEGAMMFAFLSTHLTSEMTSKLTANEIAAISSVLINQNSPSQQIAGVRSLLNSYPTCALLHAKLGCGLMFRGANYDPNAGIALLMKGLKMTNDNSTTPFQRLTEIDFLFLIGSAHLQQSEGDGSEVNVIDRRAESFLIKFVNAATSFGHRKLGPAHYHLGYLFVKAGDMTKAEQHYRFGIDADNAIPAFLRDPGRPKRAILAAAFDNKRGHVSQSAATSATSVANGGSQQRHGGEALAVPGVDPCWFKGDST